MVDERFNVIIGMQFQPGRAVQEAAGVADQIQNVFRQIRATPVELFDSQAIQRFGSELNREISRALRVDLSQSNVFQGLRRADQRVVQAAATSAGDPSAYAAEAIRLARAEIKQDEVRRRSRLPVGTEGAFKTEFDRTLGQLGAGLDVELAQRALAKVKDRQATQAAQELARAERAERAELDARGRATVAINRRTAADNERARQQQRADAALDFPVSFPGADPRTAVGAAQVSVNNAQRSYAVATSRLADLRTAEGRTETQVINAQKQLAAADAALAGARQRLATAELRAQPVIPIQRGLGAQFAAGFKGTSDRPYAEQIGQAFKFSVFYGTAYNLLFALTQTFAATLQEGIEFQQAVTELKLSAGRADESIQELANTLGARGTEAGFAPSQGVLVGARSLGLYGATGADAATQERIADVSARTATRLAMSSGMEIGDVASQLAAVVQAFQLGPEGQSRVSDLDAYMAHEFGVAAGATLQAVAESGTVGRAAGFSQEEVSAIAADMMSRTGQTPAAVAGFMAQIFSRGGEGSLTDVASKYGVDPSLELADQMAELAQIYKGASNQERTEISAAFGRGKIQNAAIALLQDYDAVRQAADSASTDALGKGDEAFQLRLSNIGGQIQLTVGALQDFASALGQSGLLDAIGVGVVTFRELVEAGTSVLRLFTELPAPIRAVIAGLASLAIAAKLGGVAGLGGGIGLFRSAGGAYGAGTSIAAGRLGVATAAGATAPLFSRAGAAAVGAAAAPAAAMALAVGGLYAIGELADSSRDLRKAQATATDALLEASGALVTPDDFRARAAQLQTVATDTEDAAGGWAARVYGLGRDRREALELADQTEAEAKRLQQVAAMMEANQVEPTRALISSFDSEGLAASLDLITRSGGTARERFDALAASLTKTADSAERAETSFDAKQFAGTEAQGIFEAITSQDTARVFKLSDPAWWKSRHLPGVDAKKTDITADLIKDQLNASDIQERTEAAMRSISSLAELDPETTRRLAEEIVGDAAEALGEDQGGSLDTNEVEIARQAMIENVSAYLLEASRGTKIMLGEVRLTQTELDAVVATFVAESQAIVEALPETDYGGRVEELQSLVQNLRNAIKNTEGGGTPQAIAELRTAEQNLATAEFNRFEAMRIVAQQNATSRAQVAAIGGRYLRKEIAAAVKGGNQDLLVQIIGQAGEGAIGIARAAIEDALATARAALRIQRGLRRAARAMQSALSDLPFFGDVGGEKPPPLDTSQVDNLESMLAGLATAPTAGNAQGNVYGSGSDVPGYQAPEAGPSAEQLAADRKARRDAALEFRTNMRLLSIDITDPVAEAAAALAAARDKLRTQMGDGRDVVAANRVDVRRAQAELEATKFSQRLEAVQTAEELGRISHQKYIHYLENERRRLNAIKDRTFQQQSQLDQIDRLLQTAADAMQGQWNFGDINLPTPYQVRRYVEEHARQPMAEYQDTGDRGARIYIDGADTGKVLEILKRYVGQTSRTNSTYARKK